MKPEPARREEVARHLPAEPVCRCHAFCETVASAPRAMPARL